MQLRCATTVLYWSIAPRTLSWRMAEPLRLLLNQAHHAPIRLSDFFSILQFLSPLLGIVVAFNFDFVATMVFFVTLPRTVCPN
jgi:hypothetical protein